ncbi:MAG: radical SAM protein [Candidatus Omnitrophica bacterium]|nr:radical SAM protein [Candidatus Omnitrophota bacterium]
MKDILLVNPSESYQENWGIISRFADKVPPLNLLYLLSFLHSKGFKGDIVDCNIEADPIKAVLKKIKEEKYSFVGFTTTTPLVHRIYELSDMIKKNYPDIIQLAGGPHATFMSENFLENSQIDFVVRGEGENTLLELLQDKSTSEINGLSYRRDTKIIHNPDREIIKDLNTLPIPEYELLPVEKYLPSVDTAKRLPVFHLMTSRGCPMKCIFCVGNLMFNKTWRMQSAARMAEECQMAAEKFGARQIRFIDDNFVLNNKRVEEFSRLMIKKGLHKKLVWSCAARIDSVNQEILPLMKEAGCFLVYFGIESGNEGILQKIDKKITKKQIREATALTRRFGLESRASFVIGLPTETKETVLETIEFARSLKLDYASFSIAVPYPGTELYEIAKRENRITTDKWDNYIQTVGFTKKSPVYCPPGIAEEDLKRLQKYAFRRFYFYHWRVLRKIAALRHKDEITRFFNILTKYILGL